MANTLVVEGNLRAAISYTNKALELDPLSATNHHFKGFVYYLMEEFDQVFCLGIKVWQFNLILFFQNVLGRALLLMGRVDEALDYNNDIEDLPASDLTAVGGATLAHIAKGYIEKYTEGIEQLKQCINIDLMGSALNYLILCYKTLGQLDETLTWVEKGLSVHLPLMLLLHTEPF